MATASCFPLTLMKFFTVSIQNAHFNFLKIWLLTPHKLHIQKYNKFQQNFQAACKKGPMELRATTAKLLS